MIDIGQALSTDLPAGIVREATPPERLVIVWADEPPGPLLDRLQETSHLPLVVEPAETMAFVEVSGPPSLLLVDVDRLTEESVEVIDAVREVSSSVRVCVLAGPGARTTDLRLALRAGLTDVLDPTDEGELTALVESTADGAHPSSQRVLAVGAHPDDVEIGCAATLLRHRALGHSVSVLTLSRGAVGGPREERRREAVGAAVEMTAELLMGDLPDTRMEEAHEMIGLIEGVIAAVRPTTVYVHSQADNHQDHRAVHEAVVIAARRVRQLFCYQSPSSRNDFAPTRFVPVDDTIEGKVEVLGHYRSQSTRHYLEPDLVVASARYWARQLTHARYAEPFEVLRASDSSTL